MRTRLEEVALFDGPSVYLPAPAVALRLSLDPGTESVDGSLLLAALERLVERAPEGLAPLLMRSEPLPTAEAVGWLGRDLQRLAGVPVELMASHGDRVWIEYCYPGPARAAARLAVQIINELAFSQEPRLDIERAFDRLIAIARGADHGLVGRAFADAARRRSIPMSTIDPRGRVVEFGTGCYRKRILSTGSSMTPSLGSQIAKDKFLASSYLRSAGIPAPAAALVRTADEAATQATSIGYPVVLKPLDLADSNLVFVDIRDEAELRARFESIMRDLVVPVGQLVLERFVRGNVYRALIVGDRVVGVFQRVPAHVFGNGTSSVRQLVELENATPERQGTELLPIQLEDESLIVLARQGLTTESVPEPGRRVELKSQIGHKRDGGLARECTEELHPENARLLIHATRAIGLDVAGIDFVTSDCARPLIRDGGAIIELNGSPDFERHLRPSAGAPRDGAAALIDLLFPPGQPVRVPIVAVCGGSEAAEVVAAISWMLAADGKAVGMVADRQLTAGGLSLGTMPSNHRAAIMALNHPSVEIAVVETQPAEIVEQGTAFEVCDVAVITGLSGASPAGLPEAESVVCRLLTPEGAIVVPADDAEVVAFARSFERPIVLYGAEPAGWRRQPGERAVWVRESKGVVEVLIVWDDGDPDSIELSAGLGRLGSLVCAAIGAVLAVGIPRETVRRLVRDGEIVAQVG